MTDFEARMQTAGFWDIDEGINDPARFFAIVRHALPSATTMFVEGNSVATDVVACYRRFIEPGPYLPPRQTIWPRGKLFRCVATAGLFQELGQLAMRQAAPEFADHIAIYDNDRPLLVWHDAFANAILLDGELPESAVRLLANEFHCNYGRVKLG